MAIDIPVVESHIRQNIARLLPRLTDHAEFGQWKDGAPIAIVGGGPSLPVTFDELRKFSTIMACGSVHDFLIDNGIMPTYAVACEPNPNPGDTVIDFIRKPRKSCEYLMASSCPPDTFEKLSDYDVTLWHLDGGVDESVFNGELVMGGGCTVTLRAIPICFALGYQNLHFFGFDSSFHDSDHAYPAGDHDLGKSHRVRVGGEQGREFRTTWAWVAQAEQFQDIIRENRTKIQATVHGDGMIAEIVRIANMGVTQ